MECPAQILLSEIDAFLARTGLTPSAFGSAAIKDPCFVGDLRAGREPRSATIARIRDFMRPSEAA